MKIKRIATGLLMVVIALYAGAYAMEYLPKWMEFANFMTACLIGVSGFALALSSIILNNDKLP